MEFISIIVHRNTNRKRQRTQLKIRFAFCRKQIAEDAQVKTPSVTNLNKVENLKTAYERECEYITRGAIVHSRINWYEYQEKNNKYFLNLENNNETKSLIRNLKLKDGINTINSKVMMHG